MISFSDLRRNLTIWPKLIYVNLRLLIFRRWHQINHQSTVIVPVEMDVLWTVAFVLIWFFWHCIFSFKWSLSRHWKDKLGIKCISYFSLPALIANLLRSVVNFKVHVICKLGGSISGHSFRSWTRSLYFIVLTCCIQFLFHLIIVVYAWLNSSTMTLRRF